MSAVADLLAPERPHWHSGAACRGLPTSLFYPALGEIVGGRDARAVCGGCRVRLECLADALETESVVETYGIRAGLAPRERRRLARDRAPATAVVPSAPEPATAVEPVVVRMRRYAAAL